MFQSIRNFFRDAFFGKDELPAILWSGSFQSKVTETSTMLTQGELQRLQRIMSREIRLHEEVRISYLCAALDHSVGSEDRSKLFREHREIKAHLKKLSALQHRLKHKIAAKD